MSAETRKLYRSRGERMIAGVCGGLGEYFGIDPTLCGCCSWLPHCLAARLDRWHT